MTSSHAPRKRARGAIKRLPSGSLRVSVYAGVDPVSGRRHYIDEVVPAGPNAEKRAEKVRTKLLNKVDEKRGPRTNATVDHLMSRHLEISDIDEGTRTGYASLIRNHIGPLIGKLSLSRIDGEVLDSFYKQLRTCRAHCCGRSNVEHRTERPHDCDDRCGQHRCRPLSSSSIRKVHAILMGAGKRAVRWGWLGTNPFELAESLPAARPNPQPPTAAQAATIAAEAWLDLDWGMLVWLAMMTGARRGELCALAWDRLDVDSHVLTIRSSIWQRGGRTGEKDTKTHQQRRISLDEQTFTLLTSYRRYCAERADLVDMPEKARIFSPIPDGSTWLKPDSVSQRYVRMCARLGWDMNIHQLRHYSATELITSGVDVRTVAGRLGHSGGGTTTLKVYSAWVAETDQRAAGTLAGRLPTLPVGMAPAGALTALEPATVREPASPYQRIADDLRGAILCGAIPVGEHLPTVAQLAIRYEVSTGTAQRAIADLRTAGLVAVRRGKRAVVIEPNYRKAGVRRPKRI